MEKYSVAGDPRGLIFEAYQIERISSEDCRSIFFDWVLGLSADLNAVDELKKIYNIYSKHHPNHPMSKVLAEGLSDFSRRSARRRRTRRQI